MEREDAGNTLGELLRVAREAKGLTLQDANRDTKIAVSVLDSLEHDDFDAVESDIYLKGFVRNYAEYLGVDPNRALRMLNEYRGTTSGGGDVTWDYEETLREEKLTSPQIFRRFVFPVMLLLIALLAILYYFERRKVDSLTPANQEGYLRTEALDAHRA
ncbi:MAG: helix-turn-helix domain-containing protein [bacterium]|nr:helix-turn-helix domain-containing protein [bacterium]